MSSLFALLARVEALPWREALDTLLIEQRREFIFDNVALYRAAGEDVLEVEYARAVGRGRAAEADAAWGERLAADILRQGQPRQLAPSPETLQSADRLSQAYLLGWPIILPVGPARALVFVCFGGPPFEQACYRHAEALVWAVKMVLTAEYARQLQDKVTTLQRQLGLQEDFLATVSHQLRTPLGFIKGYTTSLLRSDANWDEATRREFLSIIDEEADRLANLIEHLLESARWEHGDVVLNLQTVRLDSLVRDAALRARQRYPKMEIYLSAARLPPIRGDATHLMEVLENLFSNAARHAPGATVTVRMRLEGNQVHLLFRDSGPGIPAEILPHLFQRFYRPFPTSGSGLGLYICRQIVEAHGGKIWAESQLGQGTTFHILLPLPEDSETHP